MWKASAALIILIVAAVLATGAAPHANSRSPSRLRGADPGADALIDAAVARSETFKRLVAELDASDLIVYVAETDALRPDVRGALRFMGTGAGPDRFLRIDVRPGDPGSATGLIVAIATLAHELMHALEVAAVEHVVDDASFELFYKAVAHEVRDAVFDTRAAREIGQRVHFELTGRKQ
jgi:hypothetical protein